VSTVEHPNHYGGDVPTEPIKVIRKWGLNFALGNAVKYISRAGKKDPAREMEDLEKALFYLKDEVKSLAHDGAERVPVVPITMEEIQILVGVMPAGDQYVAAWVLLGRLFEEADVARVESL
jgi:hypothetical protein